MILSKLFKKREGEVSLGFSSIGKAMADSCPFIFSVESTGKRSDRGFMLAVSGEAVDNGSLKLDMVELHRLKGNKFEISKYGFKRTEKKDGGFAYQLSLKNFFIPEGNFRRGFKKADKGRNEMDRISKEIQFKFVPKYSGGKSCDVLIGIFPYENIISGGASQWIKLSPDKDCLKKIYTHDG